VLLLAMLVVCMAVSTSSAATTPSWYPQLKIAVIDARHSGAAIGACVVPVAAKPKAGRSCVLPLASEESGVLDRVSVYAETGEYVGPCKRLLFVLDHTTTAGAARALVFATHPGMTMAQDVSGRRALQRAATHVSNDFAALQHCLGKV
jgi:hypothetical protein